MTKGFWVSALIIPILLWFSFFFVLQENFRISQLYVENTVYEYSQSVAKKGAFHEETFDKMYQNLRKMGQVDIYLSAFREDPQGQISDYGYGLLGKDLRQEGYDIFKITVIYKNKHPITAVLNQNFFYGQGSRSSEITLGASSSCYIQ